MFADAPAQFAALKAALIVFGVASLGLALLFAIGWYVADVAKNKG